DRKFIDVNPDNFDAVLAGMKPHLAFAVDNKLSEEPNAPQLKVDLQFNSLEDFNPEQGPRKVKPLKELLELRTKLSNLRSSLQGNDKLDELLHDVASSTEKLNKLRSELGPEGGKAGEDE